MFSLRDQCVLVTGGTGSFGRAFTRHLLDAADARKVIVFSRDELKQHEMRVAGFDDPRLRFFIGDVRDIDRLRRAFRGVDVVVHAAALKQVPACEYNPIEAIKTNIDGARNVIDAALDADVKRVMGLSTDKAVNPVNLYGATKLCAEKLFVQANAYSGVKGTKFGCVRYGNVVGSRGSVVPLFMEQRRTGRLTITDPRMTRFWITLEQGVRFVSRATCAMHGGEVFVPKIPSTSILQVARVVAPEAEVVSIGMRAGEKLHEALIGEDEARNTLEFDDQYVVLPANPTWPVGDWSHGRPLSEGFRYTSDNNPDRLTNEQLASLLEPRH